MKLGIMQPYFLPYPGYFALIRKTDRWVVFDTPQFIYHGWIARNRILKQGGGWHYLIVPCEGHARDASIRDVRIKQSMPWRETILGQLTYYRRAPHHRAVSDLVEKCLSVRTDSLAELNVHALETVCRYLDIRFDASVLSRMDLDLSAVRGPGDWALHISRALGAAEYLNPESGRELFDPRVFEASGVALRFLRFASGPYDQGRQPFEPDLSIVDLMMFLPPDEIRARLDRCEII